MLASDIAYKHVGKTFRSLMYPNKNKTAKPLRQRVRDESTGNVVYVRQPGEWALKSFQFYDNGNIIVNAGSFYLHPDTVVELLDSEDE